MTIEVKNALLGEIDSWESNIGKPDVDLGGLISIGVSMENMAIMGELTEGEVKEVHERARQAEGKFRSLAETDPDMQAMYLKAESEENLLPPFAILWSRVVEGKVFLQRSREGKLT